MNTDEIEINKIFKQYESIIKSVEQASRIISKAVDKLNSPSLQIAVEKHEKLIRDVETFLNTHSTISSINQALRSRFEEIEYMGKLTLISFESIKTEQLLPDLDIYLPELNILNNSLMQMSISYATLWKTIEKNFATIFEENPIVLQQPSVDFYHASRISYLFATQDYYIEEKEKSLLVNRHRYNSDFLFKTLSQIFPEAPNLYQGAISAILSNNTDKQRHFTVSLRELFRLVFHGLAPNNLFLKWNKDPTYVDKGQPTRRGRLAYIYRDINFPPFLDLIEKDIDNVLELDNLLQKGVHSKKKPFTKQQLWAILYRMESFIYFLIKISYK